MTYTDNPFLARTQQEPAGQGESHEERIAVCEAYVDAGQAREEGGNPFKPKVLFTPFGKILRTISGNVVSRKNTQISRKNTLNTFGIEDSASSDKRCCSIESFSSQPQIFHIALFATSVVVILSTIALALHIVKFS